MLKVINAIIILLLPTIALATTCATDDTNCITEQREQAMIDQANAKPIRTDDKPKSSEPQPFTIPAPTNSAATQTKSNSDTQDQTAQPSINPGLKIFGPQQIITTPQNNQQETTTQAQNTTTIQPITKAPIQPITKMLPTNIEYR